MPGLNRIILIDTHLKGVVELIVDDHTNICGTNASGKTTLQRLIPVFYGEYPSRVVPATRDSFERWYLPTEQSFIVYEYRRMDERLCQAVLAADTQGRGVTYRLVQKGFALDDYIKSRQGDAIVCHTMNELGRQWKQAGVPLTTLLNTRQFRAIIQNDRSLLSADGQRTELRLWARQFSLCDTGQALRHIEKLARAVHSREGKMETIKSMIAAILEEDGVTPPASQLNPQRVEAWVRECRLIQGFAAIRPEFEKLERDHQDLLACELRLAGLLLGYRTDEPRLYADLETTRARLDQLDIERRRQEDGWQEQRDRLNQALSFARADNGRLADELDGIETRYRTFLEADIEQLRADLEQVDAWRDTLANLRARHRLSTEGHQDLERTWLERQQAIKDQREAALERLREQENALRDERDLQKDRRDAALNALEQAFAARRQEGLDRFREREYRLREDSGQLRQQIDSIGYSEAERCTLALFEQRLEQAEELREAAEAKVRELESDERPLRSRREAADAAYVQAGRRMQERQEQLDDIERILYPGHHTLLEFLRREQPGWETRLGRVIHPDLLQRTDLKPGLDESAPDSLFGLHLDVTVLDIPDHAASETQLRQRRQLAEEALQEARHSQQEAERQLQEAQGALDALQRSLVIARSTLQQRRDDRQRLREERQAQKDQFDALVQARRAQARRELVEAEAAQQTLTSERDGWLADLQQRHGAERLEKSAHWQQVIASLEQQLAQLKTAAGQRKADADAELAACERWYQNELKARGVDQAAIVALKTAIATLDQKIIRTEQRRTEVLNYEDWYRQVWLKRKPQLQDALSESQTLTAQLEAQLAEASATYTHERRQTEEARQQALRHKGVREETLARLKGLLRRLGELKLPRDGLLADGEVDERLRLGEELLQTREQQLAAVKAHIERFDSLIAGQAGSSLAETWERSRGECTLLNERGIATLDYRRLVPHLEQLLNVMVPQSLTALREQGKLFGIDLNAYYDVLADIDRRIGTQSARITREVGEELFLDGIAGSAVRIRSRIGELEFWPDLKAFIKAFREWREAGFDGLPGEEYTGSLRRALDLLGRSAQGSGIAGLLDIELRLREGNSDLVIRTDRQLNESSSHGMAYLILCKFLLAFTRLLRGDAPTTLHWPIDELGTLHHNNVKKIFDACTRNNIRILGAFPNPEADVLALFANRYIVNKQTRQLQVVRPRPDRLAEKLQQHRTGEVA